MHRLLQFLYRYRAFILFLVLEGMSFWIVVENNSYQGAKFFNAWTGVSASIFSFRNDVTDYFNLKETNLDLATENARLKQRLLELTDSTFVENVVEDSTNDLAIKAKVIDNSLFFKNNYLIINKGTADSVREGMGVVGPDGIVGQVRSTTEGYAVINSVLHDRSLVSSVHKSSGALCSVVWDGQDPLYAQLQFLPRHISVQPGDSITTSGFNSVFPPDYQIGMVEEVFIGDDDTFYEVRVRLSTDYFRLSYVYILDLQDKEEVDSLRSSIMEGDNG